VTVKPLHFQKGSPSGLMDATDCGLKAKVLGHGAQGQMLTHQQVRPALGAWCRIGARKFDNDVRWLARDVAKRGELGKLSASRGAS
jgi:hypothetical protein